MLYYGMYISKTKCLKVKFSKKKRNNSSQTERFSAVNFTVIYQQFKKHSKLDYNYSNNCSVVCSGCTLQNF